MLVALTLGSQTLRTGAAATNGPDDSNIPACADFAAYDPNTGQQSGGTYVHNIDSATLTFTYYLWANTCADVEYHFTAYPAYADPTGTNGYIVNYATPLIDDVRAGDGSTNAESYSWNNQLPTGGSGPAPDAFCVVAETLGPTDGTPSVLDRAPELQVGSPQCYPVIELGAGSGNFY